MKMQAAFATRCSPARFQGTCGALSDDQKVVVIDIGFGGLLQLDFPHLPRALCLELVNCFNVEKHAFWVNGVEYLVTFQDVSLVFSLPDSGIELQLLFLNYTCGW